MKIQMSTQKLLRGILLSKIIFRGNKQKHAESTVKLKKRYDKGKSWRWKTFKQLFLSVCLFLSICRSPAMMANLSMTQRKSTRKYQRRIMLHRRPPWKVGSQAWSLCGHENFSKPRGYPPPSPPSPSPLFQVPRLLDVDLSGRKISRRRQW